MTKDIKTKEERLKNQSQLLLEDEDFRNKMVDRVYVLDKVKKLVLLPNMEFATSRQVADFYETDLNTIEQLTQRNKNELLSDGFKLLKRREVCNLQDVSYKIKPMKGYTLATFGETEIKIGGRGISLYPKRSVLRIGMMLQSSDIATEVRNQLLNIEENTSAEVKVRDINEEQSLMLAMGMAMANGDLVALTEANTKMMAFKNRHISSLEETIEAQKPKIEHHDNVLKPNIGLMNVTTIAKDLGTNAQHLNKILNFLGVIYKKGSTWFPYADYQYLVKDGYCDYETFVKDGMHSINLKWTERGRKFIIDLVKENGLL